MTDDQPSQPLTDAELAQIKERTAHAVSIDEMDESDADNVYELLAEVDRLRAALTALGRNEQAAGNRSLELQEENERLRLEVVQIESGAQIAMNAGVTALQEVKRLEKVCADLKEINDRMAEDRLRLVDELDGWEDNATDTLRMYDKLKAESVGTALGHLAKIERLQSQRDALVRKLGLDWGPDEFGDLDALPTKGTADRCEMLSDLRWYISDLGLEHWQTCPMGAEDCYLCAGHVAIRDRWKGVE